MSNWAMGWAQRQRLGDPIAKSVLYTMCYVMRDDTLAVYVGIPTLEELTEFEDRAIRKAIQRLVEIGMLVDTGRRKNNIPVYRIPGYEAWLSAQQTSSPQDGRASNMDSAALTQVAELVEQKRHVTGSNTKPSRDGEGATQALPSSPASPPVDVPQALPSTGGNLRSDQKNLNPSAGARAIPSGSRPAKTPAKTPEEIEREATAAKHLRASYGSSIMTSLLGLAPFYDAMRTDTGKVRPTAWDDLTTEARATLPDVVRRLVDRAIAWATDIPPKSATVIDAMVHDELVLELKRFRKPTPSERATMHADAA